MPKLRLTEAVVARLPPCESGQVLYYDTVVSGLALNVGARVKTYLLHKDVNGKSAKISLGRVGVLSLEQARQEAAQMICQIIRGIDPRQERQRIRIAEADRIASSITLGQLFDTYVSVKTLKPTTLKDFKAVKERLLNEWSRLPISSISSTMVLKRHRAIGAKNGHTTANRTMRYLRAVFAYAEVYHGIKQNPVRSLSLSRSWYPEKRRTTLLRPEQIKGWYEAVKVDSDQRIRDLAAFILLTGCRLNEALRLQWQHVNLDSETPTLIFMDAKTGNTELPITTVLSTVLERRKQSAKGSAWVFPGKGQSGHLSEPKKAVNRIEEKCGLHVCWHDLRRTLETLAESMDVSHYALKGLLGHSIKSDVTGGYIIRNVERLREPAERVAQKIKELVGGEI